MPSEVPSNAPFIENNQPMITTHERDTMSTNPGRIQLDLGDRNMTRPRSNAGARVRGVRAPSGPFSARASIVTTQLAADCCATCTRAASHSPMDTAFEGLPL